MERMQAAFSSRASAHEVAGGGRGLGPGGRLGASRFRLGGDNWRPWPSDADGLGPRDSGERAGLGDCGRGRLLRGWSGGIVGNFANHFAVVNAEMDAGRISYGDVKSAQDELGAADIDGVADQGVDDLHERGLDAFFIFYEGDGVKARLGGSAHSADHPLMEVAEDFAAESGGTAAGSVDFDVRAAANVLVERHWR